MDDDLTELKEGEVPEGFQIENEEPVDVDAIGDEDPNVALYDNAFPKEDGDTQEIDPDIKEMEELIFEELGYEAR